MLEEHLKQLTDQERQFYQNAKALVQSKQQKELSSADWRLIHRMNQLERLMVMDAPYSILQQELYLMAKGVLESENDVSEEASHLVSSIELKRANHKDAQADYHALLDHVVQKETEKNYLE